MASMTFVIEGDVSVSVTVTEIENGDLRFDVTVLEGDLTGDLQGLFFDMADDSLVAGLNVEGVDATDYQFDANNVTNLGQGVNINGEVLNEYGAFDAGVQIGTQGMATDDIQTTSFVISHDSETLTLADIAAQDFAVRLTSVGPEDGARTGSLKLGGTSPDAPDPEGSNVAVTDTMTVGNADSFDDLGDLLDGGTESILFNDLSGSDPYAGMVATAAGDAGSVGSIIAGSNGGLLIIDADGSVNFSANGEFDHVSGRVTEQTTFVYGIEGGSQAEIIVTVTGFNEEI